MCFKASGLFFGLLIFSASVQAADLLETYLAALIADPTYQAAIYEHAASQESVPMARAGLLPQLAANGGYSINVGQQDVPTRTTTAVQSISQGGQTVERTIATTSEGGTKPVDYQASQYGLSLRWSIFNLESIARFRQAYAQEAYGDAKFDSAYNDLVLRVASGYFDALLAQDTLMLAQAQVDAYRQQLQAAQKNWQAGEGSRTEVAETEARLASAEAELLAAQDQNTLARALLKQISGMKTESLKPLRPDFTAQILETPQLETWQGWAVELSPLLVAQRQSVESARKDIDRAHAGHWPKLDVVGSAMDSRSDSPFFANSRNQINSIGVQMSMPLYSGGYVNAASRQAEASLSRSQSELDAKLNAVMLDVEKYLRNVLSGVQQVAAYEKAVSAQGVAVQGAEVGFKYGTRIQVEVLDAQRLLFQSKRNLAQARYQYLLNKLRLIGACRLLTEEDVRLVNAELAL